MRSRLSTSILAAVVLFPLAVLNGKGLPESVTAAAAEEAGTGFDSLEKELLRLAGARKLAEAEARLATLDRGAAPPERFARLLASIADGYLRDEQPDRAQALIRQALTLMPAGGDAAKRQEMEDTLELARRLGSLPRLRLARLAQSHLVSSKDKMGLCRLEVAFLEKAQSCVWDTGANLCTMTESCARRHGLDLLPGEVFVGSSTGGRVAAHLAILPRLRIGECLLENVLFLVLPDSALTYPSINYSIDAILGFPVMDALGKLRITPPDGLELGLPEEQSPEGPNLLLDGFSPKLRVAIAGRDYYFLLDSGANHSALHPSLLNDLRLPPDQLRQRRTRVGGAGGSVEASVAEIPRLELQLGGRSFVVENLGFMTAEAAKDSQHDGVVGNDLLNRGGAYDLNFRSLSLRFVGKAPTEPASAVKP